MGRSAARQFLTLLSDVTCHVVSADLVKTRAKSSRPLSSFEARFRASTTVPFQVCRYP